MSEQPTQKLRRAAPPGGWATGLTFFAGGLLIAALAGCGGGEDGTSDVEVAEARVSAREQDLADAEADFAETSAEFCGASEAYITALDRYGDVITQTAATVGDVNDAGTDLERAARRTSCRRPTRRWRRSRPSSTRSRSWRRPRRRSRRRRSPVRRPRARRLPRAAARTPLAPAATVNRVKQAEAEFSAVQEGITDETPLAQASQQFNAAVVALEMAWLRLFADAGCLTDEQQVQAEAAVRDYTTALQTSLRDAGYYAGEVDGVYGPATVGAVEALQEAHGLPSTGTVDKATAAALQDDLAAKGGATAQQAWRPRPRCSRRSSSPGSGTVPSTGSGRLR